MTRRSNTSSAADGRVRQNVSALINEPKGVTELSMKFLAFEVLCFVICCFVVIVDITVFVYFVKIVGLAVVLVLAMICLDIKVVLEFQVSAGLFVDEKVFKPFKNKLLLYDECKFLMLTS
uniref:Uncharacterized protein n=1 Tax=Glossina austeni TaxID=7395 RepID=A0A1A9VFF0_GLOAU